MVAVTFEAPHLDWAGAEMVMEPIQEDAIHRPLASSPLCTVIVSARVADIGVPVVELTGQ